MCDTRALAGRVPSDVSMRRRVQISGARTVAVFLLIVGLAVSVRAAAAEIQLKHIVVDGDEVRGQWGSKHSVITQVGRNHFKMELGDQPGIPHQAAFSAFHIRASAKGNPLRMDVVRGKLHNASYREYFFSWSTDKVNWHPVDWQGSSLVFPEFPADPATAGCGPTPKAPT